MISLLTLLLVTVSTETFSWLLCVRVTTVFGPIGRTTASKTLMKTIVQFLGHGCSQGVQRGIEPLSLSLSLFSLSLSLSFSLFLSYSPSVSLSPSHTLSPCLSLSLSLSLSLFSLSLTHTHTHTHTHKVPQPQLNFSLSLFCLLNLSRLEVWPLDVEGHPKDAATRLYHNRSQAGKACRRRAFWSFWDQTVAVIAVTVATPQQPPNQAQRFPLRSRPAMMVKHLL